MSAVITCPICGRRDMHRHTADDVAHWIDRWETQQRILRGARPRRQESDSD